MHWVGRVAKPLRTRQTSIRGHGHIRSNASPGPLAMLDSGPKMPVGNEASGTAWLRAGGDESMSHSLSLAEVEHVAGLARLGLAPDEMERLRDQLSSILGHIGALNRLDTDAISPTAQVLPLTNVLRPDETRPSLSQDAALANAPRAIDGFFAVQAVLGGAGDGDDTP